MIDLRCNATTATSGPGERSEASSGNGVQATGVQATGLSCRCQLLAGHGRLHAVLVCAEGHRRIRTWTVTPGAIPVAELPADGEHAAHFPWAPGCPTIEDPASLKPHTGRRRGHLRVVA